MISGDKSLGKSVGSAPSTIGQDGVIRQGTPSGPPHEGSRETHDGRIISVPRDYCWTPCGAGKVLIGYKIWAFQREATNLADSVLQTSLRSHVKNSIIKHCYGDDAGKLGGFTSHTHNAECTPKTWSQSVLFESRNAVRDNDEWWMNRYNTWGILEYKKDITNYPTPTTKQIDPKMYLASATTIARPALPDIPFGSMAKTAGGYIARGAATIAEGGALVTGALAGGFLLLSTSPTAGPAQDQPSPPGALMSGATPLTTSLQQRLQNIVRITNGDPCPFLIAMILNHMDDAQSRREELLNDKHGLFKVDHDIGISPYGSWNGHIGRYNSAIAGLTNAILMAKAAGCKVPPAAYFYLTLATVTAPR